MCVNLRPSWCDYHKMVLLMNRTQISPLKQSTAPVASASVTDPVIRRIWALIMVAFGFGLTVAWVALLGYGFVMLLGLAL